MAFNDIIKLAIKRKFPAVDSDDTLMTAANTMATANVSALVVKIGKEIAGIVSISDIIRSIVDNDDLEQTLVSSLMTPCEVITGEGTKKTPCVQLDESQDVISALQIMDEAGVHHLLVSSAEGNTVGMVSSLEILKVLMS